MTHPFHLYPLLFSPNNFPYFPFLLKDCRPPLMLIFSFLATRRRCSFGVVPWNGSGGRVRCALLRNKWMDGCSSSKERGSRSVWCNNSIVPLFQVWLNNWCHYCCICIIMIRKQDPILRCVTTESDPCKFGKDLDHFGNWCVLGVDLMWGRAGYFLVAVSQNKSSFVFNCSFHWRF